jgi:integrase/recombinase XerC
MKKKLITNFCDNYIYKIYELYLDFLIKEKKYSDNTIQSYQNDIDNFIRYKYKSFEKKVDKNFIEKLDVNDFREWLSERLNNHINNSNARALSSLRSLFKFWNENKYINNGQIFKIKTPKITKSLPRAVDFTDIKRIIEIVEKYHEDQWQNYRDLAILFVVFGCGLRISEALSLTKNILANQENIVVKGKGNKQRMIPLLPVVKEKIDKYLALCPYKINNDQPIFLSIENKFYNRSQFAKLIADIRKQLNLSDDVTPHSFRHSFATELLSKNVDLRTIQELLGHASLSTTQIYTKIDKNKLLQSIKKFSIR